MKKILEIRAAEGGLDSKLFVEDLASAYEKTFSKLNWKSTRIEERPGFTAIEIKGKDLSKLKNESGGHRIQRIPPTEKRGRIHTSTVTVAIIDDFYNVNEKYLLREDHHYFYEPFKSTGPGGQHKNKTQSAIKCIHLPTGIKQERTGRNQHANKHAAKEAVDKILDSLMLKEQKHKIDYERSNMVGSGMRGDKIRTYRFQEDIIIDHRTNKKFNLKQIMRGNLDKIWKL